MSEGDTFAVMKIILCNVVILQVLKMLFLKDKQLAAWFCDSWLLAFVLRLQLDQKRVRDSCCWKGFYFL